MKDERLVWWLNRFGKSLIRDRNSELCFVSGHGFSRAGLSTEKQRLGPWHGPEKRLPALLRETGLVQVRMPNTEIERLERLVR